MPSSQDFNSKIASTKDPLLDLSRDFLWSLKLEEPSQQFQDQLESLTLAELDKGLQGDKRKTVFWINLYNAYNLFLMRENPKLNDSRGNRMRHFKARQIKVAGQGLSLMDIENGILRRSKVWWGGGYLGRWKISGFERKMRVKELDPRIHFALNCGALSCPPIRFYTLDGIEEELDLATKSYLSTEVRIGEGKDSGTLYVSSLFRAYPGDFKKFGGALSFIRSYRELPERPFGIKYTEWDRTVHLEAFEEA